MISHLIIIIFLLFTSFIRPLTFDKIASCNKESFIDNILFSLRHSFGIHSSDMDQQPLLKRAKMDCTEDTSVNEPQPGPSHNDDYERKRKIPKLNVKVIDEPEVEVEPNVEMEPNAKVEPNQPKVDVEPKEDVEPEVEELKLVDLNQYVLYEIWERLTLNDLCAIAEVCKSLKENVQRFFTLKHRKLNLSLLADPQTKQFNLGHVRPLMHNFGHLISELTVNFNQLDNRAGIMIFAIMLRKYCISTLTELILEDYPNETFVQSEFGNMAFLGITLLGTVSNKNPCLNLVLLLPHIFSPIIKEMVMNGLPAGTYRSRYTMMFNKKKSVTIQEFVKQEDDEENVIDVSNEEEAEEINVEEEIINVEDYIDVEEDVINVEDDINDN